MENDWICLWLKRDYFWCFSVHSVCDCLDVCVCVKPNWINWKLHWMTLNDMWCWNPLSNSNEKVGFQSVTMCEMQPLGFDTKWAKSFLWTQALQLLLPLPQILMSLLTPTSLLVWCQLTWCHFHCSICFWNICCKRKQWRCQLWWHEKQKQKWH